MTGVVVAGTGAVTRAVSGVDGPAPAEAVFVEVSFIGVLIVPV